MNKKYTQLKVQLDNEKARLLTELEALENDARTSEEGREGSPFNKREEEASESLELEKRLAMEKQVRDNLTAVEHALEKFDDGTYGLCDSCGKPIGEGRLEALPQASLCVECKAKNAKPKYPAA